MNENQVTDTHTATQMHTQSRTEDITLLDAGKHMLNASAVGSQASDDFDGSIEYREDDLRLDAIGKAFFYGHKRGISGSKLLSKRFTLKGIKERVSIVDNKIILTFVKENSKTSPRSKEPSLSMAKGQRSRKSTYGKDPEGLSIISDSESPHIGAFRYHKTRESAINHLVFYLNQTSGDDKLDKSMSYKMIDLNNVKSQLISSDDKLTFGVNTGNGKHATSPHNKLALSRAHDSLQVSPTNDKHVTFINPFGGSLLESREISARRVSEDSYDESPYADNTMKDVDIDIVELKNLAHSQIAEILAVSKEEKILLCNRISHLDKRVQVLEQIAEQDEDTEINPVEQKDNKMTSRMIQSNKLSKKRCQWMISSLADACTMAKSSIAMLLDTEVTNCIATFIQIIKE